MERIVIMYYEHFILPGVEPGKRWAVVTVERDNDGRDTARMLLVPRSVARAVIAHDGLVRVHHDADGAVWDTPDEAFRAAHRYRTVVPSNIAEKARRRRGKHIDECTALRWYEKRLGVPLCEDYALEGGLSPGGGNKKKSRFFWKIKK